VRAETCSDVTCVIYTHKEVVAKEAIVTVFICDTHATGCTHPQLTLCSWALLERLQVVQPFKNFLAFYGTRRFISRFTRSFYLSLSWDRPIQSTSPHPTPPRSSLILSIHLRLGLRSGLFPYGFLTNNLCAFLFSSRATCSAHLILLDLIILIVLGEGFKSRSSSLWSFLRPPVTPFLFGPNIPYTPLWRSAA
jgi:hypothetical protein